MSCPRCDPPAAVLKAEERWALVGNPNTGKSSLVNALAGASLEVGNWPGTTLERLSAHLRLGEARVELVDLPGTYSLLPTSPEEGVVLKELLQHPPDRLLLVLDGSNLERSLVLALEAMELGLPMALVVNLLDEAEAKGLEVDLKALEEALGLPVAGAVASRGRVEGVLEKALQARVPEAPVRYPPPLEEALGRLEPLIPRALGLLALLGEGVPLPPEAQKRAAEERERLLAEGPDPYLLALEARYQKAQEVYRKAVRRKEAPPPLTERLDRLVLHPLLGLPLFLLAMFLAFRFTFALSAPWVDLIGRAQEVLAGWSLALPLPALLRSFLAEGVVAGVGTVLSFTPVLFLLYLALAFLETSGFLARMAFVADRLMQWAGLPGKAFIPLVLGFGCNVPAIYATRALSHPLDRLRVALAIPFLACGARLPVFTLFAFAFFPKQAPLVVFGLYLLGLGMGFLTAFLLGKALRAGTGEGAMELPPYRFPPLRLLLRLSLARTGSFVRGAGGPILLAVLLIWALLHVPLAGSTPYALLAQALTPLFRPLGLEDWRLVGALIPGFVAKEVVVGALGVSFLGAEALSPLGLLEGLRHLGEGLLQAVWGTLQGLAALFAPFSLPLAHEPTPLQAALTKAVTPAGALAYLVFVLLYTPCVATLAALRQVVGGRVAALSVGYQLLLAYLLALAASRVLP
ncbi:ferrous iron transport protein B [Thermus arciformis]|uniref:Ferrous iron transport protein B n=1 Tax=Thermus arciformis TaxID=482827 RepID=A0A1G7DLJ5_9DEIN|nr:ferrous iron transport protein B [Thermus arciformis]SDE52389.1 ferrous iron transport protein B [Thermus arciformis]